MNVKKIKYAGRSLTLDQWAEATGLTKATIIGRLRRGWNVKSALTQPARPRRDNRPDRPLTKRDFEFWRKRQAWLRSRPHWLWRYRADAQSERKGVAGCIFGTPHGIMPGREAEK